MEQGKVSSDGMSHVSEIPTSFSHHAKEKMGQDTLLEHGAGTHQLLKACMMKWVEAEVKLTV